MSGTGDTEDKDKFGRKQRKFPIATVSGSAAAVHLHGGLKELIGDKHQQGQDIEF